MLHFGPVLKGSSLKCPKASENRSHVYFLLYKTKNQEFLNTYYLLHLILAASISHTFLNECGLRLR